MSKGPLDLQNPPDGDFQKGGGSGGGTGAASTQVQGATGAASADIAYPVKTGAVYHTTQPTYTNGQITDNESDVHGNQLLNMISRLDSVNDSVTSLIFGHNFGAISSAATTVVKTGAGVLHTITIAGGTAGAITVYDSLTGSGTTIVPTFTPGAVSTPITLTFDVAFAAGLTIVTAAATIITVSYR